MSTTKAGRGAIETSGLYMLLGATFPGTTKISKGSNVTPVELLLPNTSDTLVGRNTTDTLTNKTISGLDNQITDLDPTTIFGTELTEADMVLVRDSSGVASFDLLSNDNIDAAAAIELSKLEALTADRALISSGMGEISASIITTEELVYLSGLSSNAQDQIDAINSAISGLQPAGNYITALTGDVTAAGPGSAAATITDGVITNAKVSASAAIALSKLATVTASRAIVSDASGLLSASAITTTELNLLSGLTAPIVTTTATQTLTNKTLTSPVINNFLELVHATTPPTPSAGRLLVYPKADNKLYQLDSTGLEKLIGAGGSGSGSKNYILNPDDAAAGWVALSGAAVATTTVPANLPEEFTKQTAIAVIAAGTVRNIQCNIDDVDMGKTLSVTFAGKYAGNPTEYTIEVNVYPTSTDRLNRTNGVACPVVVYLRGDNNNFSFTTPGLSSGLQYLELIINKSQATALFMSSVLVGPGQLQSVPADGPWPNYSPTQDGLGALTIVYMQLKRDAGWLKGQIRFVAASPSGNTALFSLPPGLSALLASSVTGIVGRWYRTTATLNSAKAGPLIILGGDSNLRFSRDEYTLSTNPLTGLSGNTLFVPSETILLDFEVPIAEWAGQQIAIGPGSTVEFASNNGSGGTAANSSYTTGSVVGNWGSVFPAVNSTTVNTQTVYRVDFSAPIQDGDKLLLEYQPVGAIGWTPAAGSMFDFEENGAGGTFYRYGFRVERGPGLPDNSVVVVFGNGGSRQTGNAGAAGEAWSAVAGLGWRWRVRKESAGSAAGIQTAGANNAGTVSTDEQTFAGLKKFQNGVGLGAGSGLMSDMHFHGGAMTNVSGTHVVDTPLAAPSVRWLLEVSGMFNTTTELQPFTAMAYGVGPAITAQIAVKQNGFTGTATVTLQGGNFRFQIAGAAGTPSNGNAVFKLYRIS